MYDHAQTPQVEESDAVTAQDDNTLPAVPDDPKATLTQVRSLLFGEAQRQTDDRLSHLFDLLRDAEQAAAARMDLIERRIEDERHRAENVRRRDLIALGDAIESLGRDVKRLAAD